MRSTTVALPGAAVAASCGIALSAWRAAHAPLPSFRDLDASGHFAPDDRSDAPGMRPLRIAALGDSTLTGPGLEHGHQIWIAEVARRLAESGPVHLASHAVGGSRIHDVRWRQVDAVVADPPDVAVVAVGSNDAIHGTLVRRAHQDLTALLEVLTAHVPEVLLFGIGDLSVIPRTPRSLRGVLSARSRQIDRVHARVAEQFPSVTRVPAGPLALRPFRDRPDELFADDQFHPSAAGHRVWADAFEPFVALAAERVRRAVPAHR